MRPRRPRQAGTARWALVAAVALSVAGCAMGGDDGTLPQNALDPAGPVARAQDNLWNIVFPIAVVVFVLVQAMLLVAMFRYRARRGDDPAELPKQVAGNTRLEVVWTLIPALILVGIAVPTVRTIFELSAQPDDALEVRVVGKQYWWEFEYLDDDDDPDNNLVTANELHIPTDRPVYLRMESLGQQATDAAGVVHSFWVPRLAGKQDVVPGHERNMTIQADEPGVYPGQCAEFCGLSHANMRFVVIAQEEGEFEQWREAQSQPAQEATSGLAAQGAQEFVDATCIACHSINGFETADGTQANARVGPDLTHLASRDTFAGATFENTEENLRAWLRDPPGMKPGSQMPNLQLSDEQIDALVAYLQTLQ